MRDQEDATVLTRLRLYDFEGLNGTTEAVPTYADNAAALAAGLEVGDIYRTGVGALMIVYSV